MPTFTDAQRASLKSFILADPTLGPLANSGDYNGVANGLNALASPAFVLWKTTTPVDVVSDAIVWANMTPAQAPDGTQAWANRSLQCQGKQFNLQNMLIGRSSIPSGKANFRAGLQDCLTAFPSKADGTNQPAGWTAVQTAMQRNATVAEKVLATGTGSTASPADIGWEGTVSVFDIGFILS